MNTLTHTHSPRILAQQLHALVPVVLGFDAVADAGHTLALLLQALDKRSSTQAVFAGLLEAAAVMRLG